jgi:hypothetical protein
LTERDDEAAHQAQTARARWLDPAWRIAALSSVETQLAERGLRVTGPPDQAHIRPWSTVMSFPANDRLVWFKASGPGNAYEACLLDALARWGTQGDLSDGHVRGAGG